MKFFIEITFKTIIILSIINYIFMAFGNNLYGYFISNKTILQYLYILIGFVGIFMGYHKVLPDWIKIFNNILKYFTK
jgi:hypothetical protein